MTKVPAGVRTKKTLCQGSEGIRRRKFPSRGFKFFPRIWGLAWYATAMACSICPATAQQTTHQPGPAESLYLQLSRVELDSSRVFRIREISLNRAAIHISFDDGTIAFTKDIMGRTTGAFFEGDGEVLLAPPDEVERKSMSLFTGMAILEERFSTAYFRFNDSTPSDLQPGLRAPENAEEFIHRWSDTARNLADPDAMRLLSSFSEMMAGDAPGAAPDNSDRFLHARFQGNQLGVFDLFYDTTAAEQVEGGRADRADDGTLYYDVWTSFSVEDRQSNSGRH
ncbi:MAG TPA: hypothetical protein VND65_08265, partial [Candidatus Binatia bacterium]|nr:hypothetical protein [Candidatus Binatia bacterium]